MNVLEERDQVRQQAAFKRLAVLERHNNPPRLLLLLIQKHMQRLEVIIEVFPPLQRSAIAPFHHPSSPEDTYTLHNFIHVLIPIRRPRRGIPNDLLQRRLEIGRF